ncbi:homer protein homolog 1-like isoform X2 [Lethenteron reissneri]|uniref:homer protein homolog 1-like isoform X2 n=1 Tax=Lethenteron reissneri TaxID=7753 RepID=UPI002AB6F714|nr:homer protein homolog 1-like isoform X2 [Lethenteron reissneri]
MYSQGTAREQPVFSSEAQVFQIDPTTQRSWLPVSQQVVRVSFYHDAVRNIHRIISIDGTKVIINSTILPSMKFTKTSQKFGQWADSKANTVFGLGFNSEKLLMEFSQKFEEMKEASAGKQQPTQDGVNGAATGSGTGPSSTTDTGKLPPRPLGPLERLNKLNERPRPPVSEKPTEAAVLRRDGPPQNSKGVRPLSMGPVAGMQAPVAGMQAPVAGMQAPVAGMQAPVAGMQAPVAGMQAPGRTETWAAEMAACRHECEQLQHKVAELEGRKAEADALAVRNAELSGRVAALEARLAEREQELGTLKMMSEDSNQVHRQKEDVMQKLKAAEERAHQMESQLRELERRLADGRARDATRRAQLQASLRSLDGKISELADLRNSLAQLAV